MLTTTTWRDAARRPVGAAADGATLLLLCVQLLSPARRRAGAVAHRCRRRAERRAVRRRRSAPGRPLAEGGSIDALPDGPADLLVDTVLVDGQRWAFAIYRAPRDYDAARRARHPLAAWCRSPPSRMATLLNEADVRGLPAAGDLPARHGRRHVELGPLPALARQRQRAERLPRRRAAVLCRPRLVPVDRARLRPSDRQRGDRPAADRPRDRELEGAARHRGHAGRRRHPQLRRSHRAPGGADPTRFQPAHHRRPGQLPRRHQLGPRPDPQARHPGGDAPRLGAGQQRRVPQPAAATACCAARRASTASTSAPARSPTSSCSARRSARCRRRACRDTPSSVPAPCSTPTRPSITSCESGGCEVCYAASGYHGEYSLYRLQDTPTGPYQGAGDLGGTVCGFSLYCEDFNYDSYSRLANYFFNLAYAPPFTILRLRSGADYPDYDLTVSACSSQGQQPAGAYSTVDDIDPALRGRLSHTQLMETPAVSERVALRAAAADRRASTSPASPPPASRPASRSS